MQMFQSKSFTSLILYFCLFITLSQQENLLVVDDFTEGPLQIIMLIETEVDPSAPVSNSTFYVSPQGSASKSILGGERDLALTITTSLPNRVIDTIVGPNNNQGEWVTSTPNGGSGYVTMQYDGLDGGSMSINTTGLVGVDGNTDGLDLTFGGRAIGFTMTIQSDLNTDLQFNVYSPDGSQCSISVTIPAWDEQDVHAIFSAFSGNCDFTKVGAIELTFDAIENVDIVVTSFDTYGNDVGDIVIDNFTEGDLIIVMVLQVSVSPSAPVSNSTYYASPEGVDSPSIIGGERDLQLTVSSGAAGRVFSTAVDTTYPYGGWDISTPNGGNGYSTMQYDGLDKGSMNLNVSGLVGVRGNTNGFDLTQGGIYSGFLLEVEADLSTVFTLNVYSPDGSKCTTNIQVPAGNLKLNTIVPFSFFTGNCNFTQVGAIELVVEAIQNVDVIISSFTTHV